MAKTIEQLVEQFQCPGCVHGSNVSCGEYNYCPEERLCIGHVLGTHLGIGNLIAPGLPKGFQRPGWTQEGHIRNRIDVRLFSKGESPEWDNLNVPVWAMVQDGFLFVRTFAPRINSCWVDVVEGGTLSLVPSAINVGEFINKID